MMSFGLEVADAKGSPIIIYTTCLSTWGWKIGAHVHTHACTHTLSHTLNHTQNLL